MAVAGLVLAIVGLVFSFCGTWFSVIALPMAIAGLVLSIIAGKKLKAAGQPAGVATAGLVVGIIAVVFSTIFFFTCGICTICVAAELSNAGSDLSDLANQLEGLY